MNSDSTRFLQVTGMLCLMLIALLLYLPSVADLNGEQGADLLIFLGRFHIVVLHLPIGWLTIVPIVDIIGRKYKLAGFSTLTRILLYCAALSTILAVVVGFTLATSDGYSGATVTQHMWLGITTSIVTILAAFFFTVKEMLKKAAFDFLYIGCLVTGLTTITIAGHLGGNLVQGDDYLTEKMPLAMKNVFGITEPKLAEISYDTPIYQSFIEPMLEQNCVSCHSADKIKGKFQMDTLELLFKGGKSHKTAIEPNDAQGSELIRRISLKRGDKKLMPPKGRERLTGDQIALFTWWVDAGAPVDKSVSQLTEHSMPENVSDIIDLEVEYNTAARMEAVVAIDTELLVAVSKSLKQDFGIDLLPHSLDLREGLHFTTLNMLTPFSKNAWDEFEPVLEYTTSIDLIGAQLDNSDLAALAKFSELTHLNLSKARFKSKDFMLLASLNKLKVLNLFSTSIDDIGIEHLVKLKSLKKLYLNQTNISKSGIATIKLALPGCEVFS